MLRQLNFDNYEYRLKEEEGKQFIFDPIRKKFLVLTPEEWVRQNTIMHLHHELAVPLSHITVEKSMKLNKMTKRADILVYNKDLQHALLVECKAPDVKIKEEVFHQIARYNLVFKVNYLFVTNGLEHYYAYIDHEKKYVSFIRELPPYNEL